TLLEGLELSDESAYTGRCFAAFGDLHQLYAAVSPRHLAHAPARSRAVPAPDIWSVVQVDSAAREATRRAAPAEAAHVSASPQARLGQAGGTIERGKRWACSPSGVIFSPSPLSALPPPCR